MIQTRTTNVSILKRGFTLIELLIVISIMAILAAIMLTSLQSARARARDTTRYESLVQIRNALNRYYSDFGAFPATPSQWYSSEPGDANFSNNGGNWIPGLVSAGMIGGLPRDPQGGLSANAACVAAVPSYTRAYVYKSDGKEYKLISLCALEGALLTSSSPFYDSVRPTLSAAQVSSSPTTASTW